MIYIQKLPKDFKPTQAKYRWVLIRKRDGKEMLSSDKSGCKFERNRLKHPKRYTIQKVCCHRETYVDGGGKFFPPKIVCNDCGKVVSI